MLYAIIDDLISAFVVHHSELEVVGFSIDNRETKAFLNLQIIGSTDEALNNTFDERGKIIKAIVHLLGGSYQYECSDTQMTATLLIPVKPKNQSE